MAEQFNYLRVLLTEHTTANDRPDVRSSKYSSDILKTSHLYLVQRSELPPCLNWKFIWNNKAPLKVQFFAWLLAKDRLPMKKTFIRRTLRPPPPVIFATRLKKRLRICAYTAPLLLLSRTTLIFRSTLRQCVSWLLFFCHIKFPTNIPGCSTYFVSGVFGIIVMVWSSGMRKLPCVGYALCVFRKPLYGLSG